MIERFTKDHEWIRVDGDIGTVGITRHAQEQLGDVAFCARRCDCAGECFGDAFACIATGQGQHCLLVTEDTGERVLCR